MTTSNSGGEVAAPNITLDPLGLRGTQTARRLHQGRQRQQLRTVLFVLLLLAAAIALGWFSLQPRESGFAVVSARALPLDLGAPATLDGQGNLWLTSASGVLWRVGAEGQIERYGAATSAAIAPLASAGGGVYVAGRDGTLTAFAAPQKALWSRDLQGALATTPQLWRAREVAIVGVGDSDGRIAGLKASDGTNLWSAQLGAPIGNALAATREGFVAPTLARGVWRGGLIALDGRTGEVRWRYPADRKVAAGVAPPLYEEASNRVYWNNDEGTVASLDASSGQVVWQTKVAPDEAPISVMLRARPVILGQSLIVGGNDGLLRALETSDGKAHWLTDLGAPIRALSAANVGEKPAIMAVTEREIVLVGAAKGTILGRDEGAMAWPNPDGKGATIVGEKGKWRRVSW